MAAAMLRRSVRIKQKEEEREKKRITPNRKRSASRLGTEGADNEETRKKRKEDRNEVEDDEKEEVTEEEEGIGRRQRCGARGKALQYWVVHGKDMAQKCLEKRLLSLDHSERVYIMNVDDMRAYDPLYRGLGFDGMDLVQTRHDIVPFGDMCRSRRPVDSAEDFSSFSSSDPHRHPHRHSGRRLPVIPLIEQLPTAEGGGGGPHTRGHYQGQSRLLCLPSAIMKGILVMVGMHICLDKVLHNNEDDTDVCDYYYCPVKKRSFKWFPLRTTTNTALDLYATCRGFHRSRDIGVIGVIGDIGDIGAIGGAADSITGAKQSAAWQPALLHSFVHWGPRQVLTACFQHQNKDPFRNSPTENKPVRWHSSGDHTVAARSLRSGLLPLSWLLLLERLVFFSDRWGSGTMVLKGGCLESVGFCLEPVGLAFVRFRREWMESNTMVSLHGTSTFTRTLIVDTKMPMQGTMWRTPFWYTASKLSHGQHISWTGIEVMEEMLSSGVHLLNGSCFLWGMLRRLGAKRGQRLSRRPGEVRTDPPSVEAPMYFRHPRIHCLFCLHRPDGYRQLFGPRCDTSPCQGKDCQYQGQVEFMSCRGPHGETCGNLSVLQRQAMLVKYLRCDTCLLYRRLTPPASDVLSDDSELPLDE